MTLDDSQATGQIIVVSTTGTDSSAARRRPIFRAVCSQEREPPLTDARGAA